MIDLAWLSLAALVLVIIVSCTSTVNPGFLSIALAWVIGVYLAPFWGRKFAIGEVLAGFPTDLFLTLVGVTFLFTLARDNGTLDQVVRVALRGCRGNTGLIPLAFFGLSLGVASIGAGNIAAAALIAPLAMVVAERARISPFLMTLMVAHGCVAGALSPIAPTGIIANGLMSRMGLSGFERQNYLYNLFANTLAAGVAFLIFGGWRLFSQSHDDGQTDGGSPASTQAMTPRHWVTLAAIASLVVGVVGFQVHVGMGAFVVAVILTLARHHQRQTCGRVAALERDHDGLRCDGLDLAAGEDGRDRPVHDVPGPVRHASVGHGPDRILHRPGLGLQQHLGRGPAGLPAQRAGPGREARRRQPAGDHLIDPDRRPPG